MGEEFVSEAVTPLGGAFDTAAMARGEPGLPAGFAWRGREARIVACLERWKESRPEGGRAGGELYLRRHCYRLKMDDGAVWVVYFTRQPQRSGTSRQRWFLLTVTGG